MGDPLRRAVIMAVSGAVLLSGALPDASPSAGYLAVPLFHAAGVTAHAALAYIVAKVLHADPDGVLAAMLLVSLAAMGAEISQPLWGRSGEFMDYLSNVIGVALGAAIAQWRRQAANRAVKESEG